MNNYILFIFIIFTKNILKSENFILPAIRDGNFTRELSNKTNVVNFTDINDILYYIVDIIGILFGMIFTLISITCVIIISCRCIVKWCK